MARYMDILTKDATILHYQRRPRIGSVWSVLIVLVFTLFVSFTANHWSIFAIIWLIGLYIAYLATEKYEECILDKENNKVIFRSARIVEKKILGFRKLIVMDLTSILNARVYTVEGKRDKKVKMHQVELLFDNGLTLSMTSCLTYEPISCHEEVVREVTEFLDLPEQPPSFEDLLEDPSVDLEDTGEMLSDDKSKKED